MLLVPGCGPLPQVVLDEPDRLAPSRVVALGGEKAVADAVVEQAVTRAPSSGCQKLSDRPDQETIVLQITPADDRRSVTVAVANEGTSNVEFGQEYVLERRQNGEFVPLDSPVGPFTDELVVVPPGETSEGQQVGPTVVQGGEERELPAGDYRLTKQIEGQDYTGEFTIE